ncbi:helix-turn-helix domain-containing protein [Sinimarinibacterium flocculans]|uniref:CRP/FNR family cyclic AMP-dependent transcriptional regulator n=1 Tax=Sinimarinibacterium flocculans TaxID=985250 RepID=A0A318EE51_9GAMM|nr:helix-turn-helix domain-containing protein [Sinimarinibacterium flocculans]PXV70352.1 CRP/FNR family cyclic AMP-dependent transcriptional regulator [Sinimarinibacterium flocculans]
MSIFDQPAVQRLVAQAGKRTFRPRQLILRGPDASQVHLMLEGSASLILEHDGGQHAVLGYLSPGDFFGEGALCEPRVGEGLAVRARGLAAVASVDAEGFRRMVSGDPAFALALIDQLTRRLHRRHRQIADLFFLDATERVRRTLCELCSDSQAQTVADGVLLHINRLELAAMVGCSREMVARALRTLEAEQVIRTEGHEVLVRLPDVSEPAGGSAPG